MTRNIFIRNDRILEVNFMYGIAGTDGRFVLSKDNLLLPANTTKLRVVNATDNTANLFIMLAGLCNRDESLFKTTAIEAGDAIEFAVGDCPYEMRYLQ